MAGHAATLLSDMRRFEHASGAWEAAASLQSAPGGTTHRLALLPDGSVPMVDGARAWGWYPQENRWRPAGKLATRGTGFSGPFTRPRRDRATRGQPSAQPFCLPG